MNQIKIPDRDGRKFLVPEVIQTSEMDCGPASLKALLEGYGIHSSYGRLREACQTSVDGTSIDSIEDLAVQLGLDAEQVMMPLDHVLLEKMDALPALVVTRTPSGMTHFVVAWSQHYGWVQVMDPGTGRRWVRRQRFEEEIFRHSFPVSSQDWADWASTDGFMALLVRRMELLKIQPVQINMMRQDALSRPGWLPLAALDASIRLAQSLVKAGAIPTGETCGTLAYELFKANAVVGQESDSRGFPIPKGYWSVLPHDGDESLLDLHGAVLIQVNGLKDGKTEIADGIQPEGELPPELAAILDEPPATIEKTIWETLRQDGLVIPTTLLAAFLVSALGTSLQAFLLQGLFRFQYIFRTEGERMGAIAALFILLVALFLLEIPLSAVSQRIGRRLETRLRIAFLKKIPRLSDRYFHSRLTSDMTSRAHGLRSLRNLPGMVVGFVLSVFSMLMTIAGVVWLQPHLIWFALGAVAVFSALGWGARSFLEEGDLRVRTHAGALSRFYLDALQGLIPLRTHAAERAFRREHEGLLTEWTRANSEMLRAGLGVQAVSALLYVIFSAWVGFDYVRGGGPANGGLLLFYWTLNLPVHGQAIVGFIQQYPLVRNSLLRVLEPLDAPEEEDGETAEKALCPTEPVGLGISIEMNHVDVVAGGHAILQGIDLRVAPGEHLAVVGPSGAGKSSLVGILLGWHVPAAGECRIDNLPLGGKSLINLRRHTAWVDPAVQLWNRTLLENLNYGNSNLTDNGHIVSLKGADLFRLMERMENGLQTRLGEGGGLVSGGEGQRVRLARAMNRSEVRLVLLDEPFRGLDRDQRRSLLRKARDYWKDATLLCVTHDVGETLDFSRVLVIENGRIAEDGVPLKLKRRKSSRYAALLQAEERVRQGVWASGAWRHLRIENGRVTESGKPLASGRQ
jgi:ABC-type bacteriocin/lantibiotic exporter with double-glycine peptidase domain